MYAVLGSIILFIKLRQQHTHMGSGEVIEESFLGFLGHFFLQLCFRADFVESTYVVTVEAASQIIQRIRFNSLYFRFRYIQYLCYLRS